MTTVKRLGGETPIGSSLELSRLVNEEIPEFVQLSKKVCGTPQVPSKVNIDTDQGVLQTITYKPDQQYKGGSTLCPGLREARCSR